MTSEVALLNKTAIALAADSAVTVTYWDGNEPKTRFFKGANKIFNISGNHPVGMMTYATASLQGVPWEIVAKSYRAYLEGRSHDQLSQYATDFFDFAASNALMFPREIQDKQFKLQADRSATLIVRSLINNNAYKAEPDAGKKEQLLRDGLNVIESQLATEAFIANAVQADVDGAMARFAGEIANEFKADRYFQRYVPADCIDQLARLGVIGVFKPRFSGLDASGIVFAGYGNKDLFPRLEVY